MAETVLNSCPQCGTRNSAFDIVGDYPGRESQHDYWVFLRCRICWAGVVAVFHDKTGSGKAPTPQKGLPWNGEFNVEKVYPKEPDDAKAPDYVPENVASYYIQGEDSLQRRNWDAAGSMFRKALDTATKALRPADHAFKKKNLYARIEALAADNAITPDIQDWAHVIRSEGNDAAHDEDPYTETEASELKAFTEMFLVYVFSMPGMVRAKRAEAEAVTDADATP